MQQGMGFKELDSDRRFIAESWMISVEVDIVRGEAKGKVERGKRGNANGNQLGCVHATRDAVVGLALIRKENK